jgi:hypothetical protein
VLQFGVYFFFNLFVCIFVLNFTLLVSFHFPSRRLKFKMLSVLNRNYGLFSYSPVSTNIQNHNVLLKNLGLWHYHCLHIWCFILNIIRRIFKIAKATISFVMSVHPSAWSNSAPTGWIFMKLYI